MLRTRLTITGVVSGPSVCTMYWGATEDAAGVTAVRSALSTWLTACKPYISGLMTYTLDPVVDVVSASGALEGILSATALSVVGTSAGDPLPPQNALVIQWRTGLYVTSAVEGKPPRSHELRGRTYLSGPTETDNTAGKLTTAAAAALTTASQALADDGTASLLVFSRTHTLGTNVEVATCWAKYGVLRSRRD